MTRTLLGKWTTATSRMRVYESPDGLEIESNEQYEVTRRRVLFDDVQLVTLHRQRGEAYLIVTGLAAAFFDALIVWAFTSLGEDAGLPIAIMLAIPGLPLTILFLLRAIFGLDIVTVFGRRSKIAIRYRVRKERAREVFARVCDRVREVHATSAAEYAAEAAVPAATTTAEEAPPLPPM
jgi:hypothetical protein